MSTLASAGLALALGAAVMSGCGTRGADASPAASSTATTAAPTQLRVAANWCLTGQPDASMLGDNDTSMTLSTRGEGEPYEIAVPIETIVCVLDRLDTPDYVVSEMERTTSMMGVQEADWDGIHASWSYHPKNGFDLILTEN